MHHVFGHMLNCPVHKYLRLIKYKLLAYYKDHIVKTETVLMVFEETYLFLS